MIERIVDRTAPPAVDLWLFEVPADDRALATTLAWLTADELQRYHAFVFERHRREYLATRALVRSVLGRYLATGGDALQFTRTAYGRPALDPPCGLTFNLANHPTLVACGVRRDGELGIDVEPLDRGPTIVEIAGTVFAPRELAALHGLPEPARADRALSLWTLKEAYIKARGLGLSLPLDSFAFEFDAAGAIGFQPAPDDPRRWWFRTVDLLGHRIAIASERHDGGDPALRVHHVTQLDAAGMASEPLGERA